MNCKEYQSLYLKFTDFPIPIEIFDSNKYQDWMDHDSECINCQEWSMEQLIKKNGGDPDKYPCIHLAYYSQHNCEEHEDPYDCPDTTLVKIDNRFGIPVRDGGSSYIKINNCPWCGIEIKKKK